MTNDRFLEKLAQLPQQLSSLPWWQQNLLEESKSSTSSQPRPTDSSEIAEERTREPNPPASKAADKFTTF